MAGAERHVVTTVRGDVDATQLGRTLIHEHVISSLTCYWDPSDEPSLAAAAISLTNLGLVRQHPFASRANLILDDLRTAAEELSAFQRAGGGTVVDATSNGIGRDPSAVRAVAEMSGLNVVLGSGYYIGASLPAGIHERAESRITDEIVAEITQGIGSSGIRAGVIGEIGVGAYPADPLERRILRASARAQRLTGAGLIVHPAPGDRSAFEVARLLERAGARMDKVVMSHLDERFRGGVALFRRLARHGCQFGFDTFGRDIYYPRRARQHPSDEDRIRWLGSLADAGLAERVLLSQDICLRHELGAYGGYGYSHVLTNVLPRLLRSGFSSELLDWMLVGNPARILSLTGPA